MCVCFLVRSLFFVTTFFTRYRWNIDYTCNFFFCVCFLMRSLFFVTTTVDLAWGLFILVVHFLAVLFGKKKKMQLVVVR